MIILLTGSHGFLGGYTKRALESAGHEVWCYSRRTNSIGDTCVSDCDVIVNCAGETENPENMISANLTFTTDLIRAARVFKKRLIHIGSIVEDLKGDSLYQTTKRAATQLCLSYAREFWDMSVYVAKPATIYGSGDKEQAFLPTLWRAFTDGKKVGVTNEVRGWVHVEDAAQAIVKLVEDALMPNGTYEICTDYLHNLALFDLFEKAVGSKIPRYEWGAGQDGIGWPRYSCGSIRCMGWSPKWDIEKGVADFVTHQQCKDQVWLGAEA